MSNISPMKSSQQRAIRAKITQLYPALEEGGLVEEIIPKKADIKIAKCADRVQLLLVNNVPKFFSYFDGPWIPTLRVLHQAPLMMKRLRTDAGAIKFVLSGADIMCPGLTHPDAVMHDEAEVDEPVAIYAHGKEHAMAVGMMLMSTQEIREVNKGPGVQTLHVLADGLWNLRSV